MRQPPIPELHVYRSVLRAYRHADTQCWGCIAYLWPEDAAPSYTVTVWHDNGARYWHSHCVPSYATRHDAD